MSFIRVFDMFKVGIGPSSSHTLGPWKAALKFLQEIGPDRLTEVRQIHVTLFGSLALTGLGHATDKAVLLGLSGFDPEQVLSSDIKKFLSGYQGKLKLPGGPTIVFDASHVEFRKTEFLPFHPNAIRFETQSKTTTLESTYYSVGGGFIVKDREESKSSAEHPRLSCLNSKELLEKCIQNNFSISDLVLQNELHFDAEQTIRKKLLSIWEVMKQSAYEGCHTEGILPGGLSVVRRAAHLNKQLIRDTNYRNADEWLEAMKEGRDFRKVLTRISCLAMAVNEVNADMGRIVTAPTNGSAGVIPAVLMYYWCFSGQEATEEKVIRFLCTAAEIGKYFKLGATISAAAGGCQAEIGVSSSMAAAGLTECLGGNVQQVLMAAEIAAEHHLGMTCDPIGGLVQIPCIERNSMGAIKAVTAAMIALESKPGTAKVSLDQVIKTMKETAESMNSVFKETSLGGLAKNVPVSIADC